VFFAACFAITVLWYAFDVVRCISSTDNAFFSRNIFLYLLCFLLVFLEFFNYFFVVFFFEEWDNYCVFADVLSDSFCFLLLSYYFSTFMFLC